MKIINLHQEEGGRLGGSFCDSPSTYWTSYLFDSLSV